MTEHELKELNVEIAKETANYMATTTAAERAEADYHLQRVYDEAKGESKKD